MGVQNLDLVDHMGVHHMHLNPQRFMPRKMGNILYCSLGMVPA